MSELFIGKYQASGLEYNSKTSATQVAQQDSCVFESGQSGINPEEEAKQLGYKKTKYQNAYYDKKSDTYYKWNNNRLVFEPTNKQSLEAEKLGYNKTNNPNVFYDEKSSTHYSWDGFRMTKIPGFKGMMDSGAYSLGNEKFTLTYDTEGNYRYEHDGKVEYKTPGGKNTLTPEQIIDFEARVLGYTATGAKGVYVDKSGENYFVYNADKKSFEPTVAPQKSESASVVESESEVAPVVTKSSLEEISAKAPDGIIDDFKQGQDSGDCWLLSTLDAISQSETGKELLKEIIQPDAEGNVTINLKGAQKSYVITKEEIDAATSNGKYVQGDRDVIAVELAMEKYKLELCSGNKKSRNLFRADYFNGMYVDNPLYGGVHANAITILTGKNMTVLQPSYDEEVTWVNSVGELRQFNEEGLKEFLDNKDNIVLASIEQPDSEYLSIPSHGVVVHSYDEENVYIIDPNDTFAGPKPIKKEDFYNSLKTLTVTDLKSEPDKSLTEPYYLKPEYSKEAKEYTEKLFWKEDEQ